MKDFCKKIPKTVKIIVGLVLLFLIVWFWPAGWVTKGPVENPIYGSTFSAQYARELGLDPREVYEGMLRDIGIKKVRLVAYWDQIESERGVYDFSDLDWQIKMSERYDAEIVLAFGRRVPRWPECHIPDWTLQAEESGNSDEKYDALKDYITTIVNRYKDRESITHWQVENEAFFTIYASEECGDTANTKIIDEELDLVRDLDPSRQIIMTDSGNLGLWKDAYSRGDIFGSTFYVYLMNDGQLRTPLTHNFYKMKNKFWELIHGKRDEVWLIEISVEPWLNKPITEFTIEDLNQRLSLERVQNILEFAKETGFETQYLWGIEWHYYMRENGHSEYLDLMMEIF
jgi:hypothetical protein